MPAAPNPNQKVVVTLKTIQNMLNYFAARPYAEVFQLVKAIEQAQTLESAVAESTAAQVANPASKPPQAV